MAKELFKQSLIGTADPDLRIPLAKFADLTPKNMRLEKLFELVGEYFGLPVEQFISAGVTGPFPSVITTIGDIITLSSCEALLRAGVDASLPLNKYIVPQADLVIPSGSLSYIIVSYNSGNPQYSVVTDETQIKETDKIPIFTAFNDGAQIHILDWGSLADGLANKLHQRFVKTTRFERESGFALAEFGTRNFSLTSGILWNGAIMHSVISLDSTVNDTFIYYHSAGSWVKSAITQYNNTQYDDGTDLVELATNRFTVNWVYRTIDINHSELLTVLSNTSYRTLSEAKNSQPPTDLPGIINGLGLLVGRIIVKKNETTGVVEGAFDKVFIPANINNHNNLTSLQGGAAGEYYHLTLNDYNNRITRKRINPVIVTGTPDTLTIDFDGNNEVIAKKTGGGGIDVTGDFTLSAANFTNAEAAQVFLSIDTATTVAIALSGNMITSDNLSALETGEYQLVMTYDGGTFHVVISEPETL